MNHIKIVLNWKIILSIYNSLKKKRKVNNDTIKILCNVIYNALKLPTDITCQICQRKKDSKNLPNTKKR